MAANIRPYRREDALEYARRWALDRNPRYMDVEGWGGDCTNFASQCLFAGGGKMNFARGTGWYYISPNNRAPAWTGVFFFRRFLLENRSTGPFAREMPPESLEPGDFVLLNNGVRFYHALIVVGMRGETPLLAAHSVDVYMRPLSDYSYPSAQGLHIIGVRA